MNTTLRVEMWLFILFLGIFCGIKSEETHGTYYRDINDNGVLKKVTRIGEIVSNYDLSNLGIRTVDRNAFDELVDTKSINLFNNSLDELPEFVFAKLTKLEKLSLANNKLSNFANVFVGLTNLKTLNISNNPLRHFRKSSLFGLTKFADIIVKGTELWSISTATFENPFLREPEIIVDEELNDEDENTTVSDDTKTPSLRNDYDSDDDILLDKSLKAKICKTDDGLVRSVDELKNNETIPAGCLSVPINYKERTLLLQNFGIKNFEKGWYKLNNFRLNSIDLSNNDISEITPELLNDLPVDLAYVNLATNKLTKIRNHIIEHDNLKILNFKDNLIVEIEYGALEKTNLSGLFATGNKIKSLDFVSSLPESLHELIISNNEIEDIPDNCFSRLTQLVYLNLGKNNINRLGKKSLSGLSSLQVLIMTRNKLASIEPGTFKDLISLRTLYLYYNSISTLENGTWDGLENLKDLNLAWNQLTNITKITFNGLRESGLRELHLDYNNIELLSHDSFNLVPKFTLSLDGNKISNIPKGTFYLPNLQELHLKNNSLETINGESFDGLPRLRRLSLNANRISTIDKGVAQYMGRLQVLDLSKNPIECLKNGALFGLPKTKGSFVYISDTPLELIQGGVFEDV